MILYRGAVVETGATERVFGNPLHPYTRMLLASVPQLHRKWENAEEELKRHEAKLDRACVYHEKYPDADPIGADGEVPALAQAEDDHFVACFRVDAGRCEQQHPASASSG